MNVQDSIKTINKYLSDNKNISPEVKEALYTAVFFMGKIVKPKKRVVV